MLHCSPLYLSSYSDGSDSDGGIIDLDELSEGGEWESDGPMGASDRGQENDVQDEDEDNDTGISESSSDVDGDGSIDSREWDQPVSGAVAGRDLMDGSARQAESNGARGKGEGLKKSIGSGVIDGGKGTHMKLAAADRRGAKDQDKERKPKGPNVSSEGGKKKRSKYDPKQDDPLRGGAAKKQKNRLGQHARRKLAEAKFGREARHIQLIKEQKGKQV